MEGLCSTEERAWVAGTSGRPGPAPDETARPRWRAGVAPLGVALVGAAWFGLFRDAMVDDAFIQLRYAETLATTGRWGFYPEQTGNMATSPLNVLLLGGIRALTGLQVGAVVVVAALALTTAFLGLRAVAAAAGMGAWLPWIGTAALASNPLLCSTVGMESLTFAALTTVVLACAVRRRPVLLGATLGLLFLARPDGVLLGVVLLGTLRLRLRETLLCAAAFAAVSLPWVLVSWTLLGSAVPDTLFLKCAQRWGDGSLRFLNGPAAYLRGFPAAALLSLAFLPFAPAAFRGAQALRRPAAALAVFAVLHYAAYSRLGVPPYHWYYAPEVACAAILGAIGAAWLIEGAPVSPPVPGAGQPWTASRGIAAGTAAVVLIAGFAVSFPRTGAAADPPIRPNWASVSRYREIAAEVEDLVGPGAVVSVHGEISTLAWHCRSARFLDEFSDRSLPIHQWYVHDAEGDPAGLALRRLNFLWWSPPQPWPRPAWTLRIVHGPSDPATDPLLCGGRTQVAASWDLRSRCFGDGRLELIPGAGAR